MSPAAHNPTDQSNAESRAGSGSVAGPSDGLGEPLVVEDLLLLLFKPDSGSIAGENILFYVLGGAVLTDLTLANSVTVERAGLRGTVAQTVDGARPSDELLHSAWDYLDGTPRAVQTLLAAVGPRLRGPVLDRLVQRGEIVRTAGKALGFIPTEKLSLGSPDRRAALVERVRAVLVDGVEPDTRTAALIALVSASDQLPTFHREIPWSGKVASRAAELEHGDWGAAGASEAVTRTMAAVAVSSVVTAVAVVSRG
ncbi:MAG: GOLPH3/VPS74 family protein [Mycetocola sp.]